MGFINLADKTINAKLVYYGVGVGGKTTSLQAVHAIMCPRNEVQLVSIKTEEDSTLLFDFLPINLGQVEGFKIRIQGFTVPGQPKYRAMRKYVLQGADAVVLVVDSQRSRLEENVQALESLKENLRANGLDVDRIPIVVQYNKRDIADAMPEPELDRHFLFRSGIQAFPTIATEGSGVYETFVHAAALLVEAKVQLYRLGRGGVTAEEVAESTRRKLWDLYDHARGTTDARRPSLAVTVPEHPFAGTPNPAPPVREDLRDQLDAALPDLDLDLELEVDLDVGAPPDASDDAAHDAPATPTETDPDEAGLLDRVMQSNIDIAQSFGDLDQYRVLLERKNRDLVEIAQNTVHDLNRPLSAIKLMLTSIRKGLLGDIPEKVGDAVENGLLATRQMERLISELLDSSRLDFDGIKLDFVDVDVQLVVADVVRGLRGEIEEKDAHVRIEPMPTIRADEWALTKLFGNLIGNALQYAHTQRQPRIVIRCEPDGDRNVFTVADNGIGIPGKDLPKLFKRFQRGSNTTGISGNGLGLHIVREVVAGHGGNVWIESVEGEGTTFRIAIPIDPVAAEHSSVADVAETADL